jgi:MFS family permease
MASDHRKCMHPYCQVCHPPANIELAQFYISYILFSFLTLCWKIFPPHRWAAFVVFGWGVVATVQSGTTNWAGMMVCRFFLGLFEQGFGPGVPYLFSFFYLRHEIGLRSGIYLAMAPLATCFAGALAYGITSGHAAIASWRLLFLVEGAPVILMAVVVYFFLPDTPQKARFFTEDEKRIVLARTMRQTSEPERSHAFDWKESAATLLDLKAWLTALMFFSCNVSFASLPVFLPTILEELGFTGVNAQGLSAPPYLLSFLVTVATAWFADRTQQRGFTIMVMAAIGGAGYIMLAAASSVGVRYAGCYLAAAGIFPAIANILPWVSNNQGNDSRRGAGFVMLMLIGQCGPLLGTRIYPSDTGPDFVMGHSICAAFLFFTTLLAGALRLLLGWENRKLDRKYGTLEEQRSRAAHAAAAGDGEPKAEMELGLESYGPMYRYVL